MTTSLELAEKLRVTMEEAGMKPAALAKACGVKTPSVYDWLEHGRVHKRHLKTFARIFGKPLGYWLDDESEDDLAPDERQILAAYRELSERMKARLLEDAEHLKKLDEPIIDIDIDNPRALPPPRRKPEKSD